MNEKVRKVFDLLGVEPNEEFKIKDLDGTYMIDDKFRVRQNEIVFSGYTVKTCIADFLDGTFEIIKLPQLTEADKNAVRYLRDGGMKYVVRDDDGFLYGFKTKPYKIESCWIVDDDDDDVALEVFDNLFQFVQWTDEEPFCIEDLEV